MKGITSGVIYTVAIAVARFSPALAGALYVLVVHVALRARTDAIFPGAPGALYRAVVIGSDGHEIVVRRMLAAIAKHAERVENGG